MVGAGDIRYMALIDSWKSDRGHSLYMFLFMVEDEMSYHCYHMGRLARREADREKLEYIRRGPLLFSDVE